jgi:serine/threonine protein phosphatase 1
VGSRDFLFGNRKSRARVRQRVYAIGDIHGRLDVLDELLDKISSDSDLRGDASTTIVVLGDLIDRGPQSAEVVERLRTYRPSFAKTVFLMGNHEEILLRILGGETGILHDWLRFGGAECVRSYGIDPIDLQCRDRSEALRMLRRSIPRRHLKFIARFVDSASFGRYLFVHAGIRPGVPLAQQLPQDLRWIRGPFLDDNSDHGRIVVHGHSISETIEVRSNRIGLDTGAFSTGVLTAMGVEDDETWFLQTAIAHARPAQPPRVANLADA